MRAHRGIFTILERVFVLVEYLRIFEPKMLTRHGYHLIFRLVVQGEQMHSKLVEDVFGNRLTGIVLLSRLYPVLVILDASRH